MYFPQQKNLMFNHKVFSPQVPLKRKLQLFFWPLKTEVYNMGILGLQITTRQSSILKL